MTAATAAQQSRLAARLQRAVGIRECAAAVLGRGACWTWMSWVFSEEVEVECQERPGFRRYMLRQARFTLALAVCVAVPLGVGTDPVTLLLAAWVAGLCVVIPVLIVAAGYCLESRGWG